jgi:predicted AlkP superfamily phosphohydrolase/phosphomutase
MRRREFLTTMAAATGVTALASCRGREPNGGPKHRVLVVAFDGLDPAIVKSLMDAGRMPNLARVASMGSFSRIATSTPPHTPVAFSNIISGADASVHQVFDFIHRDPNPSGGAAVRPYFSTADVVENVSSWLPNSIPMGGNWQVPLTGSETQLLRRGQSFWDYLVRDGIDTDVYYLPANYPPPKPAGPGRFRCIAGMGTPDLLGGYGEFTMFTPDAPRRGKTVDGGRFVFLATHRHRATAMLEGPPDFLADPDHASALRTQLDIVRDPEARVAKIHLSGQVLLLNEGEWSDWIPIEFRSQMPGSTALGTIGAPTGIRGIARLFLKQVHPKLELYVSPVNMDPRLPVNRISTPDDFSERLAERFGRFHTVGIPEDTKALTHGALDESQFLAQSHSVVAERVEQYRNALAGFQSGCLFFYFGATDLLQHMFWRDRDPRHPGRVPEEVERFEKVVEETYVSIDQQVGDALAALGPTDTLIVMSDHGFTSFRRGFNLNSWLHEQGYIKLINPMQQGQEILFGNVDWSKTKLYGLGLNGLYVNLKDRERNGVVTAAQKKSLMNEIRDKLQDVRDADGSTVIDVADLVDDLYPNADSDIAPDLIVGYADGYRASWATVLGQMPRPLLEDNLGRWSGTHLTAPSVVPGVLVTNRKIMESNPSISDIAPTILAEFGIETPSRMSGKALFGETLKKPATRRRMS